MSKKQSALYIIYDHECPFCRNYCRALRIRNAVGTVKLINARLPSKTMNEITEAKANMDQGMAVKFEGHIHYGPDALHVLALLSTKSNLFNRINTWVFKSKTRTKILYPCLRECRNITLKLMRIPMIANLESA